MILAMHLTYCNQIWIPSNVIQKEISPIIVLTLNLKADDSAALILSSHYSLFLISYQSVSVIRLSDCSAVAGLVPILSVED